ncbi:MAG: hypothetical protein EB158_05970 [Nitrosopumilaceae archaeon]|nr:hypothetical protein [Nitrosopumilaceae archaeon]
MLKKYYVIFSLVFVLAFSYGLFVGAYKIFPFDVINHTKEVIFGDKARPEHTIINKFSYDTNVKNLIRIHSEQDITNKRNDLINYVWSGHGLPESAMPQNVKENISDSRYHDLTNLQRIDKITYEMDYGVNSISYMFVPKESNNKVVVYHQGHDGDFYAGKDTIEYFLKNKYTVIAFSMPLLGMNSQPVVETQSFGPIILKSHNHLRYIESDSLKPVKFFFEPIYASLNYLEQKYGFDAYYMTGISGGAWVSMYYPAIDNRISQSYPVAGPLPLYLRSNYDTIGDYETELPDLIRIANELEIYVMDAHGENRKFIQIYNKYDPCCWSGTYFETYEQTVKDKVKELGSGIYDVNLDETNKEHTISQNTLDAISRSMNS